VSNLNLNNLAIEITKSEGLKKQVNIAQVKEIMKILFKAMKKMTLADIQNILSKYR